MRRTRSTRSSRSSAKSRRRRSCRPRARCGRHHIFFSGLLPATSGILILGHGIIRKLLVDVRAMGAKRGLVPVANTELDFNQLRASFGTSSSGKVRVVVHVWMTSSAMERRLKASDAFGQVDNKIYLRPRLGPIVEEIVLHCSPVERPARRGEHVEARRFEPMHIGRKSRTTQKPSYFYSFIYIEIMFLYSQECV